MIITNSLNKSSLEEEEEKVNNTNLTDSLIVQVENSLINMDNSNGCLDDFDEVMGMMDEQFEEQLKLLKQGTHWKELKGLTSSNRKLSNKVLKKSPVKIPVKIEKSSCDASCEESDERFRLLLSNSFNEKLSCCTDAEKCVLGSNGQARKRRHRRSIINKTMPSDFALDNYLMVCF